MTEAKEGDRRVQMLLKILPELGVTNTDLILDVACGNGWLTGRLRNQGYNCVGVDSTDKYLLEAIKKRGNHFLKGNMLHLRRVLKKEGVRPKVEIINGRSIQHIRTTSDVREFDSDVVIFDALDPTTGIQAERLQKIRDYLEENHGFSKEWLKNNFWNILASIDGQNLMDRFCPPEDWWRMEMEARNYRVQIIREYNYDGKGTDNLVFVCQKLTSGEIDDKVKKKALSESIKRKEGRTKGANKFYNGSYAVVGY
jgi:SAM-dependent methyltransferase